MKINFLRNLLKVYLASFLMASTLAEAQIASGSVLSNGSANEFFVGKEFGKPLIAVNLLSGVSRPGVYHIPIGTEMDELLAYAGGTVDRADLADVVIRRHHAKTASVDIVNLKSLLRTGEALPRITDGDSVQIPVSQTLDRTLVWVLVVSGVLSAGLSAALIARGHN